MKIELITKWEISKGIVKPKGTILIVHNDTGKELIKKKIAKKISNKNDLNLKGK